MESTDKNKWNSPENILSLIKIIAILLGALWTIFLFFKFEREQKKLSLALLENQNIQAELTAQLSRLQLKKSEFEYEQMITKRVIFDQEIEITHLESNEEDEKELFLVEHKYSILNNGKTKIEVTYVVINSYLASIPTMDETSVIEIRDFHDEKGICWDFLKSRGYFYSAKWVEGMSFKNKKGEKTPFKRGGGGTTELEIGEISKGSMILLILANKNDIIGFETRIVINEGKKPKDRWRLTKTKPLVENSE